MSSLSTHEQTVNVALGEVLRGMRRSWNVVADRRGKVLREGGYPDVLVLDAAGWPVVIEAKHHPGHTLAEDAATDRLGKHPVGGEHAIETAIALVYPPEFQQLDGEALRNAISATDALEYALHTHVIDDERGRERLPESGWLRGGVIDLAMLVQRASAPAPRVRELADMLEGGIMDAADCFSRLHPRMGEDRGAQLAAILEQTDDAKGQTRRMAMTVLLNALIYHESLAQAGFRIRDGNGRRPVRSIDSFLRLQVEHEDLLAEWAAILERNYWPIFGIAMKLVDPDVMPVKTVADVLQSLWFTARRLVAGGVTRSHDLMGTVFQGLIADRKFLATYYTRPEAATLLAGLALPADRPPGGADWSSAETLAGVQIGDFACGTGTLLSAAYSRLSLLHELHEGDAKALHGPMMENGLFGIDVLLSAVHLTATMLAGTHPDAPFDGERLLTMPYGAQEGGGVSIGSLELLAAQAQPALIGQAMARTSGARDEQYVADFVNHVGHGKFDLVIMNPPFTRATTHEGDNIGAGNPSLAAMETTRETQRDMLAHLNDAVGKNPIGSSRAGLASHFVDLGLRKVREGGTLAFVLPLSAAAGSLWEGVRAALARHLSELTVVTISGSKQFDSSFSADTGMAECLMIGTMAHGDEDSEPRGRFVILNQQPSSATMSSLLATEINRLRRDGTIHRLEDSTEGGTPIMLGNEYYGDIIDCPLTGGERWAVVGISDLAIAQTAARLERGRLAVPGDPHEHTITTAPLGSIASVGFSDMEIIGDQPNGVPQGPYRLFKPMKSSVPTHPMLWGHDAKKERGLIVDPDSEGQVKVVTARHRAAIEARVRDELKRGGGASPHELRQLIDERVASAHAALLDDARRIQATATRAHYNRDLQFNSQSLIVAMTERPCIGGRAWPSVIFEDPDHEYAFALWSNSTLGLLMHWWTANKTQSGRGSTTVTGIPRIPTLNVRQLSDAQHARARTAFESLRNERFLPFDQIDEDDARAELDRALLVDVLGLPESLCAAGGPLETLRRKLAAEPQIHGGKRTRVVFTNTGERTERRADR